MVLKGVNRVHNDKIGSNERSRVNKKDGLERSQSGYTMIKLGQMVLKGVIWVHNDKIGSNGLERSQYGYIMIKLKLGQMVLKGVNRVHNGKMIKVIWVIKLGLERSQ